MKIVEKIWGFIVKRIWYLVLLTLSSIYVWHYKFEIYQLKELNARNLIFLLWLLLLLLPLFSEMEFMGVKIKKAVEKSNKEVKDEINSLRTQLIDLTFSNSFANNIQIGNGILPTEEKIEEMLQIIRQLQVNQDEDKDIEKVNDEQVLEDKAVYLFKVRLSIEKMLNEKMEALGCNNEEILKRNSLISIARRFHEKEFIDDITYHLIVEVVRIANRGIHGEIISDEYIKFVQKAYPQIQYNLKELPNI